MTFRKLFELTRSKLGPEVAFFDAAWPHLVQAVGKIKHCPPDWFDREVEWNLAGHCYGCAVVLFVKVAVSLAKTSDDPVYQWVISLAEVLRRLLEDECGVEIEPITIMPLERMRKAAQLARTLRHQVDADLIAKLDAADKDFLRWMRPSKRRKRGK